MWLIGPPSKARKHAGRQARRAVTRAPVCEIKTEEFGWGLCWDRARAVIQFHLDKAGFQRPSPPACKAATILVLLIVMTEFRLLPPPQSLPHDAASSAACLARTSLCVSRRRFISSPVSLRACSRSLFLQLSLRSGTPPPGCGVHKNENKNRRLNLNE